ncbi:MAG: hypothetical protein WBB34_13980 [Xanthobacteraceae bacterium]
MDIIASMLAYSVCMTGLLTGLVMSFVVFFSPPGARPASPTQVIAMVAKPSANDAAKASPIEKASPVETVARARTTVAVPQPAVAADAQQKPFLTAHRIRQLAERQRGRHLAFRERSSFEARFLGYDD